MHIIIANFGNSSIALLQWLIEAKIPHCTVLSVDTGWAAEAWLQRVDAVKPWLEKHGFNYQLLTSTPFADWVRDRGEFPSPKYQWCAGLVKGLPINAWLDEHDINRDAVIVLGKRRVSRLNYDLKEFQHDSEHYGARKIWHPLYNCTVDEFEELLKRSGIARLNHRSLECEPCIHNQLSDFVRLESADLNRLAQLEKDIGKPMFHPLDFQQADGIEQVKKYCMSQTKIDAIPFSEIFDMGCGSIWGCGE